MLLMEEIQIPHFVQDAHLMGFHPYDKTTYLRSSEGVMGSAIEPIILTHFLFKTRGEITSIHLILNLGHKNCLKC